MQFRKGVTTAALTSALVAFGSQAQQPQVQNLE